MFRPIRTVAPAVDLVSLAEAKAQVRDDITSDNEAKLSLLIATATAYLDGYSGILGRCLVNQTWTQAYEQFDECLELPFPDVSSVTVKYYDASNVEQTVSSANYQLLQDERGSEIEFIDPFALPVTYPYREDAVNVTLVAGYGAAASNVPDAIRHAAMLLVGHWFENREASTLDQLTDLPLGARALLAPFTRKSF